MAKTSRCCSTIKLGQVIKIRVSNPSQFMVDQNTHQCIKRINYID